MFSLRCDYRENRGGCIISTLRNLRAEENIISADKYELRDEVMTTGDYAIQFAGYVILIERKTWDDLAASIKDKRIFNNHKKMLDARDRGFRIMYLIEGRAPSPESAATKISGIPMANLMAKLDHFAMRDGVWVEYTRSPIHTAQRLLELGKNLLTLDPKNAPLDIEKTSPPNTSQTNDSASGGVLTTRDETKSSETSESSIMRIIDNPDEIIKKKYVKTTIAVRESMLSCIPGIGDKTARSLLNVYSFPDLVTFNGIIGCLTSFQASELQALSKGERPVIVVAMLSQIKGVSASIARLIAAEFPIAKLCKRDTLVTASIADIKITSTGRRIGSKLAERISETWSDEPPILATLMTLAATETSSPAATETSSTPATTPAEIIIQTPQ